MADQSLKFIHVAAIEQKQLFEMMTCFDVTQVGPLPRDIRADNRF